MTESLQITDKSMSNITVHVHCMRGKPTYLLANNNHFGSGLASLTWNFTCLGTETSLLCLHIAVT